MSRCRKCDLSRIYKQFERKKAAASKSPEVISVETVEEVKEPEMIVVQEIKRVTKSRKKKSEPVVEVVTTSTEENTSEAVEENIEE